MPQRQEAGLQRPFAPYIAEIMDVFAWIHLGLAPAQAAVIHSVVCRGALVLGVHVGQVGVGVGIVTMATLSLLIRMNIHTKNARRISLVSVVKGSVAGLFVGRCAGDLHSPDRRTSGIALVVYADELRAH